MQIVRQGLRQAPVKGGMLHVHHHGLDFGVDIKFRNLQGLFLRRLSGHADIAGAVRQQNHHGLGLRFPAAYVFEHAPGHVQAAAEGRFAPHGQVDQRLLCQFHTIRWRQYDTCPVALENHQPHLVAPLVRVHQQTEDGPLGGFHAFAGRHGPAGVHDEQNEVAGASDPDLAVQIGHLQLQRQAVVDIGRAPALLVWGRRPQRGIERQVLGAVPGRDRPYVPAPFPVGTGIRALARLLPGHLVQRRGDLLHVELFSDLHPFLGSGLVSGR